MLVQLKKKDIRTVADADYKRKQNFQMPCVLQENGKFKNVNEL